MVAKTISWRKFEKALVNHVGKKRAHMIFCEETEFESSTLYYWKKMDAVPTQAFEQIEKIDVEKSDVDRFKGYHTNRFFARVVELSNENVPIKDIAARLTEEFDRKVTQGSVKSARFRMKDKIDGYRSRGA